MSKTITITDIPDELFERLKQVAGLHQRDIDTEVIACLERVFSPVRISANEQPTDER